MRLKKVEKSFEELYADWIEAWERSHDHCAIREAYNNYVDFLNKDGVLTDDEVFNMENPY